MLRWHISANLQVKDNIKVQYAYGILYTITTIIQSLNTKCTTNRKTKGLNIILYSKFSLLKDFIYIFGYLCIELMSTLYISYVKYTTNLHSEKLVVSAVVWTLGWWIRIRMVIIICQDLVSSAILITAHINHTWKYMFNDS